MSTKNPKYLVRPEDLGIFELDESNGCYRYFDRGIVNGDVPNAYPHFTFKTLTENYGFFEINESHLELYEKIRDELAKKNKSEPDGHGGKKLMEDLERTCKNTIGYMEAENKRSFMVGVNVAFQKTSDKYEKEIERLKKEVESLRQSNDSRKKDLETIASIINRYSK